MLNTKSLETFSDIEEVSLPVKKQEDRCHSTTSVCAYPKNLNMTGCITLVVLTLLSHEERHTYQMKEEWGTLLNHYAIDTLAKGLESDQASQQYCPKNFVTTFLDRLDVTLVKNPPRTLIFLLKAVYNSACTKRAQASKQQGSIKYCLCRLLYHILLFKIVRCVDYRLFEYKTLPSD